MAKSRNDQFDNDTDYTGVDDDRSAAFRDRFSGADQSASARIDESPLIALGAGVALGAVLGAVLPASRKERELLGPIGSKINEAGTGAIDRGRDMAKQKFDEMAGDKLREFIGANGSSSDKA